MSAANLRPIARQNASAQTRVIKSRLTRDITPSSRVVIVRRALEVVEVVANEAPTLLDLTGWSAKREWRTKGRAM